jgi:hypothetical protein
MSLLKSGNRIDFRLIGVEVPSRLHSYISLYTLAKGITKAALFKSLVEDWKDNIKGNESDEELVQQIVHRVKIQWAMIKQKNPKYLLESYKEEIENELINKGILDSYVDLIVKEIK